MFCCIIRAGVNNDGHVNIFSASHENGNIKKFRQDMISSVVPGIFVLKDSASLLNYLESNTDPVAVPITLASKMFGWPLSTFS